MAARKSATRNSGAEATLQQARALVLVARTGSYHEASLELGHRDTSAVYHLLERLAESLGVGPLTTSSTRGKVVLTPDGEQVLAPALALVDAYRAFRGSGHSIRVSCYPVLVARAAATVLAFAADPTRRPLEVVFHDVSDRLRHDGGAGLVARTAAGEIDLAIAPSGRSGKGLTKRYLYRWNLRLVVQEDDLLHSRDEVSIDELDGCRLLVSPIGHRSRELYEAAAAKAHSPGRVAMELGDQQVLATIARAGDVYTAILPDDAFGPPSSAVGPILLDSRGKPIGDSYSLFYAQRQIDAAKAGVKRSQAVLDLADALQTAFTDDLSSELTARAAGASEGRTSANKGLD
jgi:DNA-binding transcriptional LysR family regulator